MQSGVMRYDAGLADLAKFNTNGFVCQVSNNKFKGRTLTGTADQIVVSFGSGVSGNPVFSIPSPLVITDLTLGGSLSAGGATKSSSAPADSTILGAQTKYSTSSASGNKIALLNYMAQTAATTGAAIDLYNHQEISATSGTVSNSVANANYINLSGASTITTAKGVSSQIILSAAGTVSSFYAFFAGSPDVAAGTLTAQYAFYAQAMTGAGAKWGVYIDDTSATNYIGGRLLISNIGGATLDASAALEIDSTDGALLLPRMTEAQRDALTAANGMLIYNTTAGKFQGREAGAWVNLI